MCNCHVLVSVFDHFSYNTFHILGGKFAIIPGFFLSNSASTPLPKLLQTSSDEREHSSTSDDDDDESYESSAPICISHRVNIARTGRNFNLSSFH